MPSDQRWKWAGIVSVISLGGVLLTDIFANVVGGYISDQIKTWQMPEHPPVTPAAHSDTVSSIPPAAADEPQVTMAAVTPRPEAAPMPPIEIPPEAAPVAATAPEPMPLPPPEPRPRPVSGTVEQVIDTGTSRSKERRLLLPASEGSARPIAINSPSSSRSKARKSAASRSATAIPVSSAISILRSQH
jgi:hypothetical protein